MVQEIEFFFHYSCSSLTIQIISDHNEVVKILIDHKADVNAREHHNLTPIHIAAEHGELFV